MSCLRIEQYDVVLEEIPTEQTLSFACTGCPLNCPGCHWSELQDPNRGEELTEEKFKAILNKYYMTVSCVLFFGGEWNKECLITFLKISESYGLKTALYTGHTFVSQDILEHLNYVKYGPYIEKLGPLNSKTTNQKLINLDTGELMNHYFQNALPA